MGGEGRLWEERWHAASHAGKLHASARAECASQGPVAVKSILHHVCSVTIAIRRGADGACSANRSICVRPVAAPLH
jgi:hypothetical protein